MTGKFEVLEELQKAINEVDRDKMFHCETGWDDLGYELDSTRERLTDCLNTLYDELVEVDKLLDLFDADITHADTLIERLREFTKWTRNEPSKASK